MDTKESKLRPCNQLIEQLKSQGLYLTEQKKIKLPVCLSPPPSITTRIMSLISYEKKTYDVNAEKRIWSLQQNLVLITQSNTLSSYTLQKKENDCIDLQQKQKFHLQEIISAVAFPYSTSINNSKVLYFIVTYKKSNLMTLFSIKNQQNRQIIIQHHVKAKDHILTLEFISKSQFLIITSKYAVFQFKIEKSSLKMLREIENIKSLTSTNENLLFMKLLARPKQEQDSLIAIFYATWNSSTGKCELNIKEMFRQLDGNIYITDPVYQIFSFTSSDSTKQKVKQTNFYKKQHFESVEIINQRQYFLLKLHHEIFIITKHFDKYVRLDAITQNFTSFKILMIEHNVPLICCIGTDSMELWHVTVESKKSNCTLMDVINLGSKNKLKESQFIKFWVMNYRQKPQTIFAFDRGGRQISFFGVKRIDKVSKLVNRITTQIEKSEIIKVQQLGKKLGVQRKSLYLKLWNENPQNPANIYLYLLQSHDLPSIHSQLEKYMRKKFILTGELIKIHTQIQNMLILKLKQELSFHNLKWFLKTNFQKRKLKLFSFDTQITFKEFQNIYNSSIFDLIQKNIDKKLFPEKSVSKIPWNEKPVEDPDINVYHILQQFKLLILQDYEQFLLRLLENYKYNTAKVFEKFPDFLPRFPFKMEVFLNTSALNSQLMISNLAMNQKSSQESSMRQISKVRDSKQQGNQSYQKYWFSEVGQQEWMRQKSSVDYIFNTLYPHYQTHQIMNLLTQLTQSQWNGKKKYVTHALISTTINTFRQRVAKIEGLKLYLSVCQFVNRVKFESQQNLESQSITKDVIKQLTQQNQDLNHIKIKEQAEIFPVSRSNLKRNLISQAPKILQIMKQKKLLTGDGYETCVLYSKMHDLMITKEIMKRQTTIADLMTTSHSSLIAAFFIGQRQRNTELFKDFFPLYKDKNLFYESLSQYINSSCCSRVELQILVKQLQELKSEHKNYNNYMAELLIHGFCLRTQIREKDEAHEIIKMFNDIGLKLDLALKLQKFICIQKQLVPIFQLFMCDKLSYDEVLNQPKKVLTHMMENYFNSNLNWNVVKNESSVITIENKQVDLDIVENTFSILLYLKQKIYVQMTEMQLSLLYGEIMIEWQQFEVLKAVFTNQQSSQSSFTATQYFQKLIVAVLDQIYTKQGIYMDDQTITYIENILSLLQQETLNSLIVREKTKLQLSKLLQKWGFTIQSVTLELICIKWKEQNRQDLIIQIMDNCIQYFDLEALENLYRLLETTRLGTVVRDIRNPESIRLAYLLAQKLAIFSSQQKNSETTNKQEEISKIIYFINKNSPQYTAEIGLMAQTFLRIVMKKYSQDPFILQAQLRSQMPDHVKFNEVLDEQPSRSPHLAVRKPSLNKLHKSFDASQQNVSNISRIKDKSNYDSKSFYNNGDLSKISGNRRVLNQQDPINGLHFDDPVILQRILNNYSKIESETRKSNIYYELTELRQWHLKGRAIIEYFVLNWQNTSIINQMYRNKFSRQVWTNVEAQKLLVNPEITFKFEQTMKKSQFLAEKAQMLWTVNIDLDTMWQVTVNMSRQYIQFYTQVLKYRARQFSELLSEKFCKVLYYGYFFLLMSLRFPTSILQSNSIEYEHIPNLYIIAQLQSKAKDKHNDLHKINFEMIWQKFYNGLKSHIVQNMQKLLPETKIPKDIGTKIMQRLLNDINKQKPIIALYMKILSLVQNFINKYVKEEKPKVLHELKSVYESMLVQLNVSQVPLIRKKSSQMRRLRNEEMKITLKEIQIVKEKIQEISQQSINYESQGIMKQIAQIFEDVKRVNLIDNEQSIKDVIFKKMLCRRQVNMSELLSQKSQKDISPFESSIILENRTVMEENRTQGINIIVKETSFSEKKNHLKSEDSLQQEYFQNHEFKFDSLLELNDKKNEKHDMDEEDHNFLSDESSFNIDDILLQSKLPYISLINPQQIISKLASKDSKFENKFHITHPIPHQMIEKIKDFSKLINSYELYYQKNSQYYLQQNLKKMLTYPPENILQILQQIYFEQHFILVTLNPKQLEANNLRKAKGLGSQEQKYIKTQISFILQLLKSLKLTSILFFDDLLDAIKEMQSRQIGDNNTKEVSSQLQLKELKKIFPLSDLAAIENDQSYKQETQSIFGRVFLSEIVINDEVSFEQFKIIVSMIKNLFEKVSVNLVKQTEDEVKKKIYDSQGLMNMLSFMMIIQLIKQQNTSQIMKQKLQYLLFNISKQFILQIHQLLQSLLIKNSQLQTLCNITIMKILSSE